MDFDGMEWTNLVLRWWHVAAGIAWIGHLYFFNFVNAQLAKTYTPDTKKLVVPELMPRALYWFRWGAAWTWITGYLLLGIVYYMGANTPARDANDQLVVSSGAAIGISTVALVVGFAVYDILWKRVFAKKETVGVAVSFVLLAILVFALSRVFNGRAVWIHIGGLFGTIMAANVWMRIWPNQRKIVAATKAGTAPDAALVAMAGLRSKHNTYMSIPLVLTMVSNHFPGVYGWEHGWIIALVMVALGWAITKWLYTKSASAAPASF